MPNLNPSVMVVDDETLMRVLLRDFFESQGYDVSCFATAAAALKSLKEGTTTPPSAILSDIRMTPMSGLELLTKVKIDFPLLPVVLFTSGGTPEEKEAALRSGAVHYFVKPFPLFELHQVIEKALLGKKPRARSKKA